MEVGIGEVELEHRDRVGHLLGRRIRVDGPYSNRALLGLGYTAVVLGLGRLLPEGSSLAVAAATLAAAAAFSPLRHRVQDLVDRRFNRRRYDAAGTVAAFAARLRDQVDLDALHTELLAVVDQTVQPTRASLWLRGAPR